MNEAEAGITPKRSNVNTIMSWGTILYFAAFIGGVFAQVYYPAKVVSGDSAATLSSVGMFFIVLATLVIFWSVRSSRRLRSALAVSVSPDVFKTGSYKFSRNPTYLALTFLMLGFGLVANSLPVTLAAVGAIILVNFTALKKEERALEEKFGDVYRQYKNKVRRWI